MPYGWGTGGVQVTASVLGPDDTLKVIDQGADDTTNAVSIRAFSRRSPTCRDHGAYQVEATIIQTRHRIPEETLTEGQVLVYQVPIPEPLRFLEPREPETREDARAGGIRADACEASMRTSPITAVFPKPTPTR